MWPGFYFLIKYKNLLSEKNLVIIVIIKKEEKAYTVEYFTIRKRSGVCKERSDRKYERKGFNIRQHREGGPRSS